ncbi:MAG: 16S rRNA (uracil(1498)-N(3))-methyltransferase [Acidobacteria bacterium]|nr:16S rRNA (uracil(1498)-N(3))-methyltransferase [Acidobacteriota bacterium]
MHARFYAPDADAAGDLVDLPEDEAAHLTRVLRLRAGAAIRVFNGRGREFDARVERAGKGGVHVVVERSREPLAREARVAVTLAQAVLKSDKLDEVVRDAVMMGVAAVLPLVAARSEVALAALQRGRRQQRWQRVAVAAAKQSGRAIVPRIMDPVTFDEVTARLAAMTLPGPGLMFVEPSAAAESVALADLDPAPPRETTMIVGPEGGWTREEIERASAVCRLVTLGGRTLRADAMPVVALAALFAIWKEL